jgi:hypothetical protein
MYRQTCITLFIFVLLWSAAISEGATTLNIRVNASTDDGTQDAGGSMKLTDADLKFEYQTWMGLRFTSVTIPRGATITAAYITFRASATASPTTTPTIYGQNISSATTFTSSSNNISSRAKTAATVNWSIPSWSSGQNYNSPSIAAIVQEIVNRSDWSSGNSLAVLINTPTSGADRLTVSYNGNSSLAPLLHVEYTTSAHWTLDETSGTTATDATGSGNTGTVTGTASWVPGVRNNGFSFNGATKIQASGLISSPTNITVAAWANLTAADTNGADVISLGDRFVLRLDETSSSKATFWNGSSWVTVSISQTFAGTGWHHFAATFDDAANSFRLYVDGVQVASISTFSSVSYSGGGSNTVIGSHGNAATNRDFTGMMDDIRVYGYALTATQVAELYGFVGHWKLNETSGTTANDSSPLATNGSLSGTSHWSTDCGGMACFDFDDSTNYFSITSASHLQPTTGITIAAWIKGDLWGTGSNVDTIARKGDNGPNNYSLSIAGGQVSLCLDESDSAGTRSTTTLSTGQWYHVAATWDGSTVSIYVNGALDNSASRSGTIGTDTRPLHIGGRSGADLFNGMIRDIRLYNRALSANDILLLAGPIGHWKFAEGSGTSAADSSGNANNATLSGGATWTSDCAGGNNALLTNGAGGIAQTSTAFTPPDVGTVAFWLRSTGAPAATARILGLGGDWEVRQQTNGTVVSDLCGDGATTICTVTPLTEVGRWYHFAATFDSSNDTYALYVDGRLERTGTNPNNMVQQAAAILSFGTRTGSTEYWSGALRDVRVYNRKLCPTEIYELYGLVGHWKMDETSGTTAVDSSGMGRNMSVVGTASWTAGKLNNSLQLNGSTRAEVTSLMGSPKNVTLAAWANLTGADTNGADVVSIGNYFLIRLNESGASKAMFYNGTSWLSASISQTYTNAGWKHFAAVFNDDANTCKFYVNGTEVASVSTSVTIPYTGQGTKTVVGAHGNAGTTNDFTGNVDDVRIYNRALCPSDISTLGSSGFGGVKITKWVEIQ